MARTFRKYATWVDWLNNFGDTLRRGLASVPKLEVLRDGRRGIDEIWTTEAKRFRKQRISRTRRRKDKRLCQRYHTSDHSSAILHKERSCRNETKDAIPETLIGGTMTVSSTTIEENAVTAKVTGCVRDGSSKDR